MSDRSRHGVAVEARDQTAGLVFLCYIAVLLAGCAPGRPEPLSGPTDDVWMSWEPGPYRVRGVLEYREDTPAGERTRRVDNVAELMVGPSGPLGLSTQLGPCVLQSRTAAHESYRYDCQDASYWFFFRRRRLAGGVSLDVEESRLGQATCAEYGQDDQARPVCVRYERELTSRMRRVSAGLQITRVGGNQGAALGGSAAGRMRDMADRTDALLRRLEGALQR